MEKQAELSHICPYLGLANDHASRFSYPAPSHCCYATGQTNNISLEHQSAFCLTQEYSSCSRFIEKPYEELTGSPIVLTESSSAPRSSATPPKWRKTLLWGGVGLLMGLFVIILVLYLGDIFSQGNSSSVAVSQIEPSPTDTLEPTATSTEEVPDVTSTPSPVAFLATPTVTATPSDGRSIVTLSPEPADIGWVSSEQLRGNHFGDSYLYAGVYEGEIYHGAFQLDLSSVPRGAPIYRASIELTGLREDRLGIRIDQPRASGPWILRMLGAEVDQQWRKLGYQDIFNAPVMQTLSVFLEDQDLARGRTNVFELTGEQIKILEDRIVNKESPKISFRLDGPLLGPDNLFAWDTGYGPHSDGNGVVFLLEVGEPPATPPPYEFVVVTSTPTPENVLTAAAIAQEMTVEATSVGTPTPIPQNQVTATSVPESLVIVPTAIPENSATAEFLFAVATAEVLTTGTPTPISTNAVTATPTFTPSPSPTPIPIAYVIITETPTAENVFAAATLSAEATAQSLKSGTPTPLPDTWVTPIVVTATSTPLNEVTAQAINGLATAMAFTTGTPTATPSNMVTATPTPVYETVPTLFTPTPGPLVLAEQSVPSALLGKILFLSDREDSNQEGKEAELVYVYDPETGELGRLTDIWPYYVAQYRNTFSADTVYRAYVKQLLWTNEEDELGNRVPTTRYAIHTYDYKFKVEDILTRMGIGIVYDPTWSPTSNQIAFVATQTGNEEIWVINSDGTQPHQLTFNDWEWDKSPSWSPDGTRIVFSSNRTGNQQLWIMNADGSDQRLLMGWDNWTPYNDWAPVWVSYLDPAPPEDQKR